ESQNSAETSRDDPRTNPRRHASGTNGRLLLWLLGLRPDCGLLLLVHVRRRNRRYELGTLRPLIHEILASVIFIWALAGKRGCASWRGRSCNAAGAKRVADGLEVWQGESPCTVKLPVFGRLAYARTFGSMALMPQMC